MPTGKPDGRRRATAGDSEHASGGQFDADDPSVAAQLSPAPTPATNTAADDAPLNTSMRLKAVTNSFAVIIAQAINKASTYIAFIIVSMQLPIADFGIYNLVFAIGQILNSVATFGMDQVLIRLLAQHGAREQRKRLLRDAIILKLVSSALAGAILLDALLWLRSSNDLVFGMAIMVADLIVVNLASTLISYDRARLRSTGPTLIQSGTRAIYLVLLVVAARLDVPWYGLLEMLLVSDALACAALAWHVGRRVRTIEAVGAPQRLAMFRDAVPLGIAAVGVLLYTRLDTILVANMRNVSEVAFYSASYKFTEAPLTIITAISATVLPLISAWSMTGSWRERVASGSQRALRYAYALSISAAVTVTFFGGYLVRLLYGSRYDSILPTVIVLIWGTVAMASNSVSSSILTGLGRQRLLMAIVGLNLVVNVTVNLWAIPRWGYFGSALATTATEGVNALAQITALCILLRRVRVAWTTVFALVIGAVTLAVYFGIGGPTTHISPLTGVAALAALLVCLVVFRLITRDDVQVVRRLGARIRRGRSTSGAGSLTLERPGEAGDGEAGGSVVAARHPRHSALSLRFTVITSLVFFFLGGSAITAGIVAHRVSWFALAAYVLFVATVVVARTWPALALGTLFTSITVEFLDPSLLRNFGHVRLDEVVGVAAAVGIALRLARARTLRPALASIPGLLPLALFLALGVESTALAAQNRFYGMTLVAQLVAGMLCYVCVALLIWEIRRLRRITTPLMVTAAIQAVIGIAALAASKALHHPLPGVRQEPGTGLIEPHGTMIEPDFFGIYLAAIAVLGVALIIGQAARRRLFTQRTIVFGAVSALAAAGAVVSLTRTAWIALIVGAALVLVLCWRFGLFRRQGNVASATDAFTGLGAMKRGGITTSARWRGILVRAGVTVILLVAVVFAAITGELATLLGRFQQLFNFQSGSGLGRVEVLQLVLQDWQRSPLTGLGVGSFTGHLPGVPTSDHVWIYSMGLAILHDTGVVGVALMVWFAVAVGSALLRALGSTRDPAARAMGVGAFCAAACMLFGAQTTSSMYLPLLWVFLGLAGMIPTLVERVRVVGAPLAAGLVSPAGGYPASGGALSVLHLYNNGDPGASGAMRQRLLMTARGLTRAGWVCSAICVEDESLVQRLKQANTLAEIVPPWDTRRRLRMTLQLMLHVQRWRPDVVMVYGATMGGAGGLAARLAGVPCVVYQTDGLVASGRRGRRMERIACSCADALWCSSASVREEYLTRRAIPADHIHLAPLGVADEAFAQSGAAEDTDGDNSAARLRWELGWEHSGPVIAYAGSLTSAGGVATLLRAYAEIARSQPDARLLVAGDGPARERLRQEARELGIASGVAFVGGMADNQPFYRLSDVVVFPGGGEDDGLGALEAMAAGRPVVATWDTDIADIIVDGENGRLAPPDDPGALAAALLWALQSYERARQLGKNASEYVRAHYSEQEAATQTSYMLEMELRTMTVD